MSDGTNTSVDTVQITVNPKAYIGQVDNSTQENRVTYDKSKNTPERLENESIIENDIEKKKKTSDWADNTVVAHDGMEKSDTVFENSTQNILQHEFTNNIEKELGISLVGNSENNQDMKAGSWIETIIENEPEYNEIVENSKNSDHTDSPQQTDEMHQHLNVMKVQLNAETISGDLEKDSKSILNLFIGPMAGITSVVAGFFIWAFRSASLLASYITSFPLISSFDPLPIIDDAEDDKFEAWNDEPENEKDEEKTKKEEDVDSFFDTSKVLETKSPDNGINKDNHA